MKKRQRRFYLAGFISVAAFIAYLASLRNEFIVWDDDRYIFENSHIHALNPAFFRWAFFHFFAGNWHPLTWISHALDYAVWGLNPLGHHLTNVILHAVNTFVVVLLAARLLEVGASASSVPPLNLPSSPRNPTRPLLSLRGGEGGVISRGGRGSYDSAADRGGFSDKGVLIAAATTGLLFGLHPLHVESVAWVSERKDLLCALFFLLSVMMYVRYAGSQESEDSAGDKGNPPSSPLKLRGEKRGVINSGGGEGGVISRGGRGSYDPHKRKWYVFSLLFFVLALMSKPMAVSLPLVLLVLDWYPFERVSSLRTFRAALVEKLPFMVLSLASAVLTVLAQKSGAAIQSMEFAPLPTRVLVGFRSLIAYLWKMVWPMNLVPFYPYPKDASLLSIEYLSSIVLVLGITAACIIVARKRKLWLSAWGYYVITLLPVLGIVQVGTQSMADRYTYLPSLGPFLLAGIMAAWVWPRLERFGRKGLAARAFALAVSVCVVVSLSYMTFRQTGIWRDSIVLWSYVIEKEPERAPFAYYNRGMAFGKMGRPDQAIADFDRAIALNPSYYEAYNNRGLAFEKMGRPDMAIKDLEMSIMAVHSSSPEAYDNLGKLYRKTGQLDKAIRQYDKAIALNPSYYEAYYDRAIVFEKTGRTDKAVEDYNKAISLNPSYYAAYNNLGVLFGNAAAYDRAIEYFTKAIALDPGKAGAYLNRGVLYQRKGERGAAVADFQKACGLGNRDACDALDALMRRAE
jgi:Tfp pilus assembly protein PilF